MSKKWLLYEENSYSQSTLIRFRQIENSCFESSDKFGLIIFSVKSAA